MSVVLRKVDHSDLEHIQKLFKEVYGQTPTKGFSAAFLAHNDLLGYCLEDSENGFIVGYFGCFTYWREYGERSLKFYNTHSWIVKQDYRNHSMKLLMPYLKLKDGLVTNFSANRKVAQVLEKLKFEKREIRNYILKIPLSISSIFKQMRLKEQDLNDSILEAHQPCVGLCLSLQMPALDTALKLILKPIDRKPIWVQTINKFSQFLFRKPLITSSYLLWKLHYVNQVELLNRQLEILKTYLFLHYKIGGLVLPSNIGKELDARNLNYSHSDTIFIKANEISLTELDYLFSEVFYLNIADK